MKPAEGALQATKLLAMVGLSNTGDKMVGTFSSGMRQRLLVARALISEPEILLLDEPTRSLDPISAHAFRCMLRDTLIAERGTTVVLATHNPEEAFSYCDRIAVLHDGLIVALGSGSSLSAHFAHDQYRIWTSAPDHRSFAALTREGVIRRVESPTHAAGSVTCEIDGGEDAAAAVLRQMVLTGNPVSRFERVPLALSTLISRIVVAHETNVVARAADA